MKLQDQQRYGAKCLLAFCNHYQIRHRSIDQFLQHLEDIPTDHLDAWDQRGALLSLNGRGDPPPLELEEIIPVELKADFHRLVEAVVEIGIVDLYGAPTDQPKKFMEIAVSVLKTNHILPPP